MSTLQGIITAGKKKYGKESFLKSSSAPRDFMRIPTGIFQLDYTIGGGIPVNATSSLWGPPAGSKTYIAQKVVVQSNMMCHRCYNYDWDCNCKDGPLKLKSLFIDSEASFDWSWANAIGVPDDLDIVYALTGEEYVDIFHSAIRATDVGLIVVDSLANLVPSAELAGSAEDTFVMSQARLVSYMVRKGKTLLMKERKMGHNLAIFILNQVRSKPGTQGNNEEIPGGHASKHDYTLSARAGRRATKKKDSEGLFECTSISVSLGSASSKKKCLVLSGTCQFDVVTSSLTDIPRGTALDDKSTIKYALSNNFIEILSEKENNKIKFIDSIASVKYPNFYTEPEITDIFNKDEEFYLSFKKRIIDKVKSEIL